MKFILTLLNIPREKIDSSYKNNSIQYRFIENVHSIELLVYCLKYLYYSLCFSCCYFPQLGAADAVS